MRVEVLTVRDCPHRALALDRVLKALALAGRARAPVAERVITDIDDAARHGFCGSPTILVNGSDPFRAPGDGHSLACRLYREGAQVDGAPSVARLLEVFDTRTDPPTPRHGQPPRSSI